MTELFHNNPSLHQFLIRFGLLGLASSWQIYAQYWYGHNGGDIGFVCLLTLMLGFFTFLLALSTIKTGRRLFQTKRLNRRVARYVAWAVVIINGFLFLFGVIGSTIGILTDPIITSDSSIMDILGGSLLLGGLFYPFHLTVIAMGVWALTFIQRQPNTSFNDEYPSQEMLEHSLALSDPIDNASAHLFEEVWISSIAHLNQALSIYERTSGLMRTLGRYQLPSGFPFIYTRGRYKSPVTLFARGKLKVGEQEVTFRALNRPVFVAYFWKIRFHNLKEGYQFRFKSTDIVNVEWYKHSRAFTSRQNLRWIKVTTQDDEFLIIAGGWWSKVSQIEDRTGQLFWALRKMTAEYKSLK